ncbi:M50 family metallopeptidase [Luteimonas salinilitoris]|uniref:M50 family metallopeptidase n=1 Tax=Luteimonas salinilitoris TaxID=3237697 RepID=A0ABV4HMZ3_9GAMM
MQTPTRTHRNATLLPPVPPTAAPARPPAWRFLRWLLSMAAFAGVGMAVGFAAARFGVRLDGDLLPSPGWALLAGFVLAIWPNIVLHEAGHAAAGLACGMRALAFGIGPYRFERGAGGWRFRHGGGVRGISGFAALLPGERRHFGPIDHAVFLFGGPLANLLTAVLGLTAAALLAGSAWAAAVQGVAYSALLLGLVNLVPFQSKGWRSDGRGLLDLLRATPDAALQQQINQLMALSMAGVRPRDWPEALLPAVTDDSSTPVLVIVGRLLRLSRACDQRDAPAARDCAEVLCARFWEAPEVLRPNIAVSLAGHAAVMLRDDSLVAAWRPLCEGGLLDLSPYRDWLDAEHAALSGDTAAALRHLEAARAHLDRVQDSASLEVLGEQLDALAARLQTATCVKDA